MSPEPDSRRNFVKKSIVTTIALSQPTFFSGLVRATGGEGETTGDVTTAPETTWVYETTFPGGGDGGLETTIPYTETLDPGAATTYPPAEYATTVPESTIPVSTITSTTLYHLEVTSPSPGGGGYKEAFMRSFLSRRAITYDAKLKVWFTPTAMIDDSQIQVEAAVEFYAAGAGNPDQAPMTTSPRATVVCPLKDSVTGEVDTPTLTHPYPTAAADEAGGTVTFYVHTNPAYYNMPPIPSYLSSIYPIPPYTDKAEYRCRPTVDLAVTAVVEPAATGDVSRKVTISLQSKTSYREHLNYLDASGAVIFTSGWVDVPADVDLQTIEIEAKP